MFFPIYENYTISEPNSESMIIKEWAKWTETKECTHTNRPLLIFINKVLPILAAIKKINIIRNLHNFLTLKMFLVSGGYGDQFVKNCVFHLQHDVTTIEQLRALSTFQDLVPHDHFPFSLPSGCYFAKDYEFFIKFLLLFKSKCIFFCFVYCISLFLLYISKKLLEWWCIIEVYISRYSK